MALTDPELDLLRELLQDDPSDDAFLQVGQELVRRGVWDEAEEVLTAGLAAHPGVTEGWPLLVRAAVECGHYDTALSALDRVDTDPGEEPEHARLKILATEGVGRIAEAEALIEAFLAVDPDDVVVTAALERLQAPPPDVHRSAADPFLTVDRAERFVSIGRPDRAVRVYRRILFRHRGDRGLVLRLRQLSADHDPRWTHDDLSEELTDPGLAPPQLTMPAPVMGPRDVQRADDEITEPTMIFDAAHAHGGAHATGATPPPPPDDDDITDPEPLTDDPQGTQQKGRRRRRSLINP